MIRPINLLLALVMVGSGAWMFVVKHQTETLERQIGGVTVQVREAERKIRVLRAEWALENDPNRLSMLAQRFIPDLKPMAPGQLVTWQQLAEQLPPPGAMLPNLPLPPPVPPGAAVPAPPARDLLAAARIPAVVPVVVPSHAVKQRGVKPRKDEAVPPVQVAVRRQAPVLALNRHSAQRGATSFNASPGTPVRVTSLREMSPPMPRHQQAHLNQGPVRPMGARVISIIAENQPLPRPRPLASNRAGATRQASAGSVFGGLGADLPPPQPIGGGGSP